MNNQTQAARSIFETIVKLLEQGAPVAMILDEASPTLDAIRDWLSADEATPTQQAASDSFESNWDALTRQAIRMIDDQDMSHWSDAHDKVTLSALRGALYTPIVPYTPTAPAVGAPVADMVPRSRLVAMERELQEAADKLTAVQQSAGDEIRRLNREAAPRFESVWCSQCGRQFGPGNSGFSHCADHAAPAASAEGVTVGREYTAFLRREFGDGMGQDRASFSIGNVSRAFGAGWQAANQAAAPAASLREQDFDWWLELASRHATADWNNEKPCGYLSAVKALVLDAQSLGREKGDAS